MPLIFTRASASGVTGPRRSNAVSVIHNFVVGQPIDFPIEYLNNAVRVNSGTASRVYVDVGGVYNFQFSAQLDKTGGGATVVYIWPRINGVNIPHSATKIVIDGPNAEIVPAWNFMLTVSGGDYFELAWQSSDTNVVILEEAASGNIPEIPSIILTVQWVSNYDTRPA